jgi:membrane fusion protein, heavy metal efflux system
MGARPINRLRWIILVALGVLLTAGVVVALAVPGVADTVKNLWAKEKGEKKHGGEDDVESAELWRDAQGVYGLRLTAEAVGGLGVSPVASKKATEPRPLPPQIGTLNYDNDRLFSIRSRFPGEVAEVKQVEDGVGPTRWRPLRYGDKVKQGDTLAVLWSRDLGEKKAALVDALNSLRLSQNTLDRQMLVFKDAALSLASLKATERQVQADSNAVLTAERTLKMWKMTDEEIQAIKAEAQIIHDQKKVRSAEAEARWARVEIKVPQFLEIDKETGKKLNLVVVEKNTNVNDMVDPINSPPLFKVADLGRLQIWVHPPEEYLPLIRESLQKGKKLKWQVRFQSEPADTPPLELEITQIAPSLEPNQHTPMVMGYLDNPEGKYLIGQFVTATIYMPPAPDTVEIPTEALNEVGGESLVFVQPDPAKREYALRRVAVVRHFKDVAFVRSRLTAEEEKASFEDQKRGRLPIRPLLPGERVVVRGVVEMTAALEALKTKQQSEK